MLLESKLSSRNELPKLIAPGGVAAEVGVHRGDYAKILLSQWDGTLLLVDPYCEYPGMEHLPERGEYRRDDYIAARFALREFRDRCRFVHHMSASASMGVENSSLQFVHIDADHREEEVARDLEAWWPKVKAGGILSGHDFLCPGEVAGGWGRGVQAAVLRFAEKHRVDVRLIVEEGGLPWTFYIER